MTISKMHWTLLVLTLKACIIQGTWHLRQKVLLLLWRQEPVVNPRWMDTAPRLAHPTMKQVHFPDHLSTRSIKSIGLPGHRLLLLFLMPCPISRVVVLAGFSPRQKAITNLCFWENFSFDGYSKRTLRRLINECTVFDPPINLQS